MQAKVLVQIQDLPEALYLLRHELAQVLRRRAYDAYPENESARAALLETATIFEVGGLDASDGD